MIWVGWTVLPFGVSCLFSAINHIHFYFYYLITTEPNPMP
jgi:hypothetical protein